MTPEAVVAEDTRVRLRAGLLSLVVAVLLLGAKYQAYRLTGSTAILSDALESIVNVVAAAFAIGGLLFAGRPADRNHPYGHGKIEFFSAAFEGGLIAFAALVILYEVTQSLLRGPEVRHLDLGVAIVFGAGVINLVLGWYLVRTGRRHHSLTLVADGQHVLSDSWTSAGIVVGLLLVRFTGVPWLDPVVAAMVAVNLLWTGFRLVRQAAGGLLDEEDTELLTRVLAVLRGHVGQGIIRIHHLRAIRAGRFHHVDAHLVVPEFWSVDRAHEVAEKLADRVIGEAGIEGELVFHTDPCHRAYCAMCDLADCPVRREPFRGRPPLTLEEAVQPDMPWPPAAAQRR
jgi:cation diffusion facilitator family transporter